VVALELTWYDVHPQAPFSNAAQSLDLLYDEAFTPPHLLYRSYWHCTATLWVKESRGVATKMITEQMYEKVKGSGLAPTSRNLK
jgi:hypothetical protein